jgi:tight adherence protein C
VILADLLNFESLLPFALFGTFAALSWWVLEMLANGKSRTVERLDELKNPRLRRGSESIVTKKPDAVTKMIEKATPALARPLEPKTDLERSRLKSKLSYAGFRSEAAASIFLSLKFALLLAGLTFGAGSVFAMHGFTQKSLLIGIGVAGGMFYLPDGFVWFAGKRRKEAVFLGLPDALDLLVVCVEAGLALDQAMRKVADEMKKTYRVIANEFGIANFQLQMGRPRTEVLHELGARTGVFDLRNLASVLIQADKFGSSIAHALRVQSDGMRTRRRQLAEEKAAKTAVKLIFPLVLFIFPGIFVVLVGPAAITMVREMFPKMGGG